MTKKIAIGTALLVGLLTAWIYSEVESFKAVRPPAGVTNLVRFLEARPELQTIRKFVHHGKTHLEVVGQPQPSLLSLPSGPPAYIFDDTGALVDWTRDLGDAPAFASKWSSLSNATSITVEQAKQLAKASAR